MTRLNKFKSSYGERQYSPSNDPDGYSTRAERSFKARAKGTHDAKMNAG
jgi:hypothetical protein